MGSTRGFNYMRGFSTLDFSCRFKFKINFCAILDFQPHFWLRFHTQIETVQLEVQLDRCYQTIEVQLDLENSNHEAQINSQFEFRLSSNEFSFSLSLDYEINLSFSS